MQHQLKACGDVKTSSRAQQNHRRSTAASAKRSVGTGNSFLATDVTNLEMNSNFMTRKLKKNANGVIGSPLSNGYFGAQLTANSFNYTPQANPYSNLDFQMAMGSGDVPSLMGMPVHKPSMMLQSDPSMDLTQFTEELQAIQNMPFQPISSSQAALQAFLAANEAASIGSYGFSKSQMLPSNSMRVSGARKNRIVEVKNQNDRLFLVLSDPQASVSTRPTLLPLTRPLQSVAQSCLDLTKKQPLSPEPLYSRKVFIGGLPIDVPDEEVYVTFGSFGKVLIDWPRRPEHNGRASDMYESEMGRRNLRSVSGYVFLVFTHENSVQDLVNACEFYDGKYYLQLSSPTMQDKAVQVRPWRLSDIDYFSEEKVTVDPRRTVFIGGVPRPTRACDLARSLQDYYGKVSYVGIDIDPELKYPKGAARVTFATAQSFVRAISGRFVQVTHAETNKRVEIKPYVMEDQYCDECEGDLCKHNYAPYYCGDSSCLQYYCEGCWDRMHYEMGQSRADHRPMVRTGDQTRILPRPPHHPAAHHSHQRPQYLLHQDQLDNHHSSRVNTSVISRMVNRNSATMLDHVPGKPFSAMPTSYGY